MRVNIGFKRIIYYIEIIFYIINRFNLILLNYTSIEKIIKQLFIFVCL